ncbi:MAG: hypothetical protein ACRDK0_13415 [Solirubrobacteraceae bacterium]
MQVLSHSRSRFRVPREISLLRKSVDDPDAGRHSCSHCRRTPLVGEQVHLYGERIVCELCRPLRREPPRETVIMHSSEHQRAVKRAVKLTPRAA